MLGLAGVAGALAWGCVETPSGQPSTATRVTPTLTLYTRLGGESAIAAVVDDFLVNVAADPRINGRFVNANVPRLKMLLVEQVCQATGGPCAYTGRDMRAAHAGMAVTDEEFKALVEDLAKSLDTLQVAEQERQELLGLLGGFKSQIVGH